MNTFIRKLFTKNWGLKLFSLLLALIFWIALIPEEKISSEKTLTIPLEAHNIPQEMELVKKPPDTVDVIIRAPIRYIDQITSSNVVAELNLENASLVQENYTLNESMINIPAGMKATVVRITPNTVNLKLEKSIMVMLDVEAAITSNLIEGLEIARIEVEPLQVPIKGAESKVRADYVVRTTPIDVSTLMQTTELEADLILPSPDLMFATSITKVKVTIFIKENSPVKKQSKKNPRRK